MRPASLSLLAFSRRMTSGMLVWIGQPCWQRGFLQPRQWFASSITCSAIVFSFFASVPILRVKNATKFPFCAFFLHNLYYHRFGGEGKTHRADFFPAK